MGNKQSKKESWETQDNLASTQIMDKFAYDHGISVENIIHSNHDFKKRVQILYFKFGDIAKIILDYEGFYSSVFCAYCGTFDKQTSDFWLSCHKCHEIWYCSNDHKKLHLQIHFKYCKSVKSNE